MPWHVPPSPATPASAIGRPISRAEALADLDTLLRTFEDVHPNLYINRPRDSVAADRQRVVASMPATMTRAELWARLAPLAASFGDGHTSVYLPREEVARMQSAGAPLFPPSVVQDDAGHLIVSAPLARSAGIQAGDRIVSLNGLSADSLVGAWTAEISGENLKYRVAGATSQFRNLLLLHSIDAPFELQLERPDGTRRRVAESGLHADSLRTLVTRGAARRAATPNFTYETLSAGVGYMNFRSMGGDVAQFGTDVADMFRRIAADSVQTLIIDLRSNGGGDSRLGEELLRHLTAKSYRMSAGKEWKMSAEYRAHLRTYVSAPLRWLHAWSLFSTGRKLMGGPDGKIVELPEEESARSPAEPFFSGAVCVLIGRQTFSSAVDLSDAIKTYHLATLVGEETGGRPNGFGEAYQFLLPNSQLIASVASAQFVRANGDTTDHRGVMPDILAGPSELAASELSVRAHSCPRR